MIIGVSVKYWNVVILGCIVLLFGLSRQVFSAPSDRVIQWENSLLYPDQQSGVNMSYLNNYNIDKNGIVFIKDGHFWSKQGRVNFFGTNLTFDACFPEKDMAEQLATQLAGLGVNVVRLHHMDNSQIWGNHAANFEEFDEDKLDKMDYLVSCLKRKGIYIDLNLHVSWQYTNDKNNPLYSLIRKETPFSYGKGLDTFLPDLITKQKDYAKKILTHYNRYTGLAYKDDPVMAMVEINNENSFYRNMLLRGGIDILPPVYHNVLNEKFRNFLLAKYLNFANLKKAWKVNEREPSPIDMNILPLTEGNNWRVQITDAKKGTISLRDSDAVIHLNYVEKNRFFQFYKTNLTFQDGQDYTIVMDITGQKDASFTINAMRQEAPYDNAGLSQRVKINDDTPNTIAISFKATKDLNNLGRITLADFNDSSDFVIHSVKLYQGKYIIDPLKEITTIEGLTLPSIANFSTYSSQCQDDITAFFQQTEWKYWSEMVRYIKKELGVRAPITGTQIDYSSPELAELYDYVDIHSYWQHPSFPGKKWDANNYYVKNVSMVSEWRNNFDKIALFRLKGKPFTISEYNHPYPNTYNAETPLMLSIISKLQDYDGVFLFDFGNIRNFDRPSYFGHSNKFAAKSVYPVSALILRDPTIKSLPEEVVWPLSKGDLAKDVKQFKGYVNPYINELGKRSSELFNLYQTKRISLKITEQGSYDYSKVKFTDSAIDQHFTWEHTKDNYQQTFFKYDEAKAKVYIGWNSLEQYNFENVALQINDVTKRYFQFSILNKDGNIGKAGHYIVTLAGREFYDGVDYFDYDTRARLNLTDDHYRTKIMASPIAKQSVEMIENFNAILSVKLLNPYQSIVVYTINPLGLKEKTIPFQVINNELKVELKQSDHSIVYCIDIGSN